MLVNTVPYIHVFLQWDRLHKILSIKVALLSENLVGKVNFGTYPLFNIAMNGTEKNGVYSCHWPFIRHTIESKYTFINTVICNMFSRHCSIA